LTPQRLNERARRKPESSPAKNFTARTARRYLTKFEGKKKLFLHTANDGERLSGKFSKKLFRFLIPVVIEGKDGRFGRNYRSLIRMRDV
jgi:hypothetical protein